MFLRVFVGLIATVCSSCVAYEPGPVSPDLTRRGDGRVWFQSSDVYDLPDMVAGGTARVIHGDLSLPQGEVHGAIILSHGSGGPGRLHRGYAERLNEMGYASFLLDHFGPRGVGNTIRGQIRVTEQGMLADVIAAKRLLASHPAIAADKIGHIGWSKGGVVAVLGAVERFTGYAGQDTPFAFTVAFYPFCGFDLEPERLSSPLLILIGAEDDWTPAEPCRREAEKLRAAGQPVEIEVYPGALHGFDSKAFESEMSSAIVVRDTSPACTLTADANGQTVTKDGKHKLTDIDSRIAYLRACATRGVTYGGNAAARDASWRRLKGFIELHLP